MLADVNRRKGYNGTTRQVRPGEFLGKRGVSDDNTADSGSPGAAGGVEAKEASPA